MENIIYPDINFCANHVNCAQGIYLKTLESMLKKDLNFTKKTVEKSIKETRTLYCNSCKATEYVRYSSSKTLFS